MSDVVCTRPPGCPASDIDLWGDNGFDHPWEAYRELRDLGPVVWMERAGMLALTRFDAVRLALTDWQTYSSARGASMAADFGPPGEANILETDPPQHDGFRKPLAAELSVAAVTAATADVERTAAAVVDAALSRNADGTFDAVADLAKPHSLTVVSDWVGFPADARAPIPAWGERAFNVMGPVNERLVDGADALATLGAHIGQMCEHARFAPGSRGALMCSTGREGDLMAYAWPGIDTTVNALGAAIWLFARHPDQWDRVRADPTLIPSAFHEVLRLHTPVQAFTRVTTRDVEVGDVMIGADNRVLVMFACANRDERHYPDADRFDVGRNPVDQLAFGRGIHLCVGINLAKLEAHTLFAEMARRIERFEIVGEPKWLANNTLHGLEAMTVRAITT
jgi:cytochrome P450